MIEPGAPLIADMSHHNSMSLLALLNGHPKVKGVIHKATQGMRFADERFAGRATEAAAHGLLFGSYHFGTDGSGVDQAEHYLAVSGLTGLKCLDCEGNGADTMSLQAAEDFVSQIKFRTGRWPGLYSGQSFLAGLARGMKAESVLRNCWLWIARYSANPPAVPPLFGNRWTLWQYTDKGEPAGLDLSRFNGTEEELRAFWGAKGMP